MGFFARLLGFARPVPADALERGSRALRRRRFDEARAAFAAAEAAAETPAQQAVVRNKRALLALAEGDRPVAAAALAEALALDPRCVPAIVNDGNLELEAGALERAVERYREALAIDPDFPDAHHNLGVAYRRLGRRAEAVRELRLATRLEARRRKPIR